MVDRITQKIKRYPFQTGILLGFLICIIFVGFVSLFRDNGRTLTENSEIIKEDYLRMTIQNYGEDNDAELAKWRFEHLGKSGNDTLRLMAADESVSPNLLGSFTKAIEKTWVFTGDNSVNGKKQIDGTPLSPRKDISGFGKIILIILGLLVLCAAILYAASVIKTRRRQKRRSEVIREQDDEPLNMITPEKARAMNSETPDTLFDLDALFPSKNEANRPLEEMDPSPINKKEVLLFDDEPENTIPEMTDADITSEIPDENSVDTDEEPAHKNEKILSDVSEVQADEPETVSDEDVPADDGLTDDSAQSDLAIETSVIEIGSRIEETTDENPSNDHEFDDSDSEGKDNDAGADASADIIPESSDNADKPLVETDIKIDPHSEDELLQMIRGSKTTSDLIDGSDPENIVEKDEEILPDEKSQSDPESGSDVEKPENGGSDSEGDNEILIHYQSAYKIGNDMYDEVFSIDQGEVFRGECGISIGETLNNTEPKAVTAFEVWLFDKDDIHTTTWYLMSDFALSNESISERLLQHGKCERIRKNAVYTLETQTLTVEIKVLDVEYGTEMEERNSYFTNVTFDVIAKNKNIGEVLAD